MPDKEWLRDVFTRNVASVNTTSGEALDLYISPNDPEILVLSVGYDRYHVNGDALINALKLLYGVED